MVTSLFTHRPLRLPVQHHIEALLVLLLPRMRALPYHASFCDLIRQRGWTCESVLDSSFEVTSCTHNAVGKTVGPSLSNHCLQKLGLHDSLTKLG